MKPSATSIGAGGSFPVACICSHCCWVAILQTMDGESLDTGSLDMALRIEKAG
jgi:hypothetical protein